MKRSLAVKTLLSVTLLALLFFSIEAFADGLKVDDGRKTFVTKIVAAKNVKGVEVRLARELIRNDCNRRTISLTNVLVSGDGTGYYDTYIFDAWTTQTKMYCPLEKQVNETIFSRSVFIKSLTNENANGEVVVSIIIPDGYKLDVTEVK
jgi:hypothetical protein